MKSKCPSLPPSTAPLFTSKKVTFVPLGRMLEWGFSYLLFRGGTTLTDTRPKVSGVYTYTQNVPRQWKSLFHNREMQQIQGRLMWGEFSGASVGRPTTTPLGERGRFPLLTPSLGRGHSRDAVPELLHLSHAVGTQTWN